MLEGSGEGRAGCSIVLATFNGEDFLAAQLDSLVAQERQPDQLVIVDDGSQDSTPDILRSFADSAPFPVELRLRTEHRGTWETFAEGLAAARCEIILICDQDDVWHPDKISRIAEEMESKPGAYLMFSDARLIDAQGEFIGASRWRVSGFSAKRARSLLGDPLGGIFACQVVAGCTMAIRSSLLPALLPFPIDVHPGLPVMMYDRWAALLAAVAGPVVAAPEPLIDYRIHPGQQIGIPRLGIRRLAPRSALKAAQFLHDPEEMRRRMIYHQSHFDHIEERLSSAGLLGDEARERLEAVRSHLLHRGSLAGRRANRFRPVMHEYRRAGGYRRFSMGLSSAVADVLR